MQHPQAQYKKGSLEGRAWNNKLFEFDPETGECVNKQAYFFHLTLLFIYLFNYFIFYLLVHSFLNLLIHPSTSYIHLPITCLFNCLLSELFVDLLVFIY